MAHQQLLEYIGRELKRGVTPESLREALLAAGWHETDINDAFASLNGIPEGATQAPKSVSLKIEPSVQSPTLYPGLVAPSTSSPRSMFPKIIMAIVGLLILGGGIFAGYWFYFAHRPPLNEKNLFSGLLGAIIRIDSASYTFSVSATAAPRDADAKPFVVPSNNIRLQQYQNDARRAQDVQRILQELSYHNEFLSGYKGPYPLSLEKLKDNSSSYARINILDPKTKKPYQYTIDHNGENFALTITFETQNAISSLKKSYGFSGTSTLIRGMDATFTKDSDLYFYLSSEPPQPLIATLAEYTSFFPSNGSVNLAASAQADWSKQDSADWKFNIDANGDFDDFTYKVNADALKKSGIYYFRINNFPDFFGMFWSAKNQWIKVDPSATSSSYGYESALSYIAEEVPDAENEYKKHKKEFTDLTQKAISIADEIGLFGIKKIQKEKVGGRALYRYDLTARKGAIKPFYERLQKEIIALGITTDYPFLVDQGYLEYLESSAFDEMFDYYEKNTSLTLWLDQKGYPAMITYAMRVVPPDSTPHLKDKQINILFQLVLSDINERVTIDAPPDAKSIESLFEGGPLDSARQTSRDARRIADIKQIQIALELYFDSNGLYPTTLSALTKGCGDDPCIAIIPVPPIGTSQVAYSYVSLRSASNPSACSSNCSAYHLGAVLEFSDNAALRSDHDQDFNSSTAGGFRGNSSDCKSGSDQELCFDVTNY